MDSKKSNKISDIVRLQQILKKWKKLANAPKNVHKNNGTSTTNNAGTGSSSSGSKSIKFLKRTLSFTDVSSSENDVGNVPKGFLAVCVGKELKRHIIPTEYLSHQAFGILLREAEEEFGFQQEGVLKLPCEVSLFEKILKIVEGKRDVHLMHHEFAELGLNSSTAVEKKETIGCYSPDCGDHQLTPPSHHHPQVCR